jgi:hypothetical protein
MNSSYHDNLIRGGHIKELVKTLLEKSGYSVCSYGYESTISHVKDWLHETGTKNSLTARRLKSSPDLLVYDNHKKDAMLVEIKMRNEPDNQHILIDKMREYQQFWSDAILVLATPHDSVLYAQRVSDLQAKEYYDADKDFERFETIFNRVSNEDVLYFGEKASQFIRS